MVKKAKILRATKLTNHVYHANVYDRYIFNVYCSCIQELRTTADSLFYAITLKYCKMTSNRKKMNPTINQVVMILCIYL